MGEQEARGSGREVKEREGEDLLLSLMHACACWEGKKRVRGEAAQVRLSSHCFLRQKFYHERKREGERER